jgi:predicted ArsR family transcriptional regulator
MTQKKRILSSLQSGNEFTAKQISAMFQVGSPTKVISELRRDGYAIYLNKRTDTKGRVTHKYRLGTPSRRMVALAAAVAGADVFA